MSDPSPLSLHEQAYLAHSLLSRGSEKLPTLAQGPLKHLAAFLFLRDESTETFLREIAPRLANLLRRRTERVTSSSQGRIRGRVDWAATQKAQSVTAGVYVCRESRLDYDQPENQCFLLALQRVQRCLRLMEIPEDMHCGPEQDRTGEYLVRLRGQWERIWRMLPSGHITSPRYVTAEQIRAVEVARANEYRALPPLHKKHDAFITTPEFEVWREGLRHACPVPAHFRDYLL